MAAGVLCLAQCSEGGPTKSLCPCLVQQRPVRNTINHHLIIYLTLAGSLAGTVAVGLYQSLKLQLCTFKIGKRLRLRLDSIMRGVFLPPADQVPKVGRVLCL